LRSDADYEVFGEFSDEETAWAVAAADSLIGDARTLLQALLDE